MTRKQDREMERMSACCPEIEFFCILPLGLHDSLYILSV
jgi:hypothetical protein